MTQLAEYIAAILLSKARLGSEESYGGSPSSILQQLYQDVGGNIDLDDVKSALEVLRQFAAAESDYSPLTGGFWTIQYDNFRYYFVETKPEPEDDEEIYRETSDNAKSYPILQAYARRGSRYAVDAANHLKNLGASHWDELRKSDGVRAEAPAANRIVTLDHNQRDELDKAATEVIAVVENENAIEGDPTLRMRVIGQLKAARELIRGETLNAYLLYLTAIDVLKGLVNKYKGQAIGHAAKKLFDLLIDNIFGK